MSCVFCVWTRRCASCATLTHVCVPPVGSVFPRRRSLRELAEQPVAHYKPYYSLINIIKTPNRARHSSQASPFPASPPQYSLPTSFQLGPCSSVPPVPQHEKNSTSNEAWFQCVGDLQVRGIAPRRGFCSSGRRARRSSTFRPPRDTRARPPAPLVP